MDNFKIEIQGLREITEALEALPDGMKDDVVGKANRDILNRLVKPQVRGAIPYSPKSKAAVAVRQERGNKTSFFVGITSKAYWLRYVEFGTTQRQTRKGYNRGTMPQRSFLDRVLEGSVPQVTKEISNEYGNIIKKVLERKLKSVSRKLSKL